MQSRSRIHRTSAQWHALIHQFESSGQSRAAFCRERNIGYPSFCLWYNRLAGKRVKPALTELATGNLFAPLTLAFEPAAEPAPVRAPVSQPAPFCLSLKLGPWLTLEVHAGVRGGHRE